MKLLIVIFALSVPLTSLARGAGDPRVDQAIARALGFLGKQQNQDGSFEGGGPRVAMTGLTLMAFLSDGHTPDVGRYGDAIRALHTQGKMARTWPLRYLIRHTAFHTLDHAWEMEDKDQTTGQA